MTVHMTPVLRKAIQDMLIEIEEQNAILDAYRAAARIQKAHPNENVALEDIMHALITGRGGISAIEFSPPHGEVLEIMLPAPNAGLALRREECP